MLKFIEKIFRRPPPPTPAAQSGTLVSISPGNGTGFHKAPPSPKDGIPAQTGRLPDRWLVSVAGALAVLIFGGVQLADGAWSAQFDSYADEPAQFVTGLMIRDYLVHWPPTNPLAFAHNYYVHYPKVAFGHWPPLFHAIEAVWWLVLPPGRSSAMLLMGLIAWLAALAFYRLARQIAPAPAAFLATCLLVAAPVFQDSASAVMAEVLSLACGVLFIGSLARVVDLGPRPRVLRAAILWCMLAILTKGTAAGLVPALLLALVLARPHRRHRLLPVTAVTAALLAGGVALFVWQNGGWKSAAVWGGVGVPIPWRLSLIASVGGWGTVVLAPFGAVLAVIRGRAVSIAAAASMISMTASSYFLRAMNEPRHWILIFPPLLLLGLELLCALWNIKAPHPRILLTGGALTLVLVLFPWSLERQISGRYAETLAQIPRPARILVSTAEEWREGPWIVEASLSEKRPSSFLVRASKFLAIEDWNGDSYKVRVERPEAVESMLDRYGIEQIIIDDRGEIVPPPHEDLLRLALQSSSRWRVVAVMPNVWHWQRIAPLTGPFAPVEVRPSAGPPIKEKP